MYDDICNIQAWFHLGIFNITIGYVDYKYNILYIYMYVYMNCESPFQIEFTVSLSMVNGPLHRKAPDKISRKLQADAKWLWAGNILKLSSTMECVLTVDNGYNVV